jgi:hypothetical protein
MSSYASDVGEMSFFVMMLYSVNGFRGICYTSLQYKSEILPEDGGRYSSETQ